MGRSVRLGTVLIISLFLAALAGCGGSSTKTTPTPVPAKITLSPVDTLSMDIGKIAAFTGTPQNESGSTVSAPVTYSSSDTSVVTIAANGLACGGTWNSLSNPQICTAGPVGTTQITASSGGVSSPPTTVYVHQHIDHLSVAPVTAPSDPCVSKGSTWNYKATAFSGQGVDITPTVGNVNWNAITPAVVDLSTTASGLASGQVQATGKAPGTTPLFASVGGVTSVPLDFITCPVQSITLAVSDNSATSFTMASGSAKTITASVLDSLGNTITDAPLTWTSSNSNSVSVNAGALSGTNPGGASIIASCTPPTCNIGFQPSLPIYPQTAIHVAVTGTAASAAVWVTTTACGTDTDCVTKIVPINVSDNSLGAAGELPGTPDSMVFNQQGSKLFLGTDRGLLGTKGLMVIDPTASPATVTVVASAPGKVLAVSPDGSKAIISYTDPADLPNRVFIVDSINSAAGTTLLINGAVAGAFSPDNLKAFIAATSAGSSTLYVFSQSDSLQTIPLATTNPVTDLVFLPNANFAAVAGAGSANLATLANCNDRSAPAFVSTTLSGTPLKLRTVGDGSKLLALIPPGIKPVSTAVSGSGCAFPRPYVPGTASPVIPGDLSVSLDASAAPTDLGQGNFVPTQLIVSLDGTKAYIVTSNLPSILVYDIANDTASAIPLDGNALANSASLTPGGTRLYVAANDGTVHVLDTGAAADIKQISFPTGLCRSVSGKAVTCGPDLIAVRP